MGAFIFLGLMVIGFFFYSAIEKQKKDEIKYKVELLDLREKLSLVKDILSRSENLIDWERAEAFGSGDVDSDYVLNAKILEEEIKVVLEKEDSKIKVLLVNSVFGKSNILYKDFLDLDCVILAKKDFLEIWKKVKYIENAKEKIRIEIEEENKRKEEEIKLSKAKELEEKQKIDQQRIEDEMVSKMSENEKIIFFEQKEKKNRYYSLLKKKDENALTDEEAKEILVYIREEREIKQKEEAEKLEKEAKEKELAEERERQEKLRLEQEKIELELKIIEETNKEKEIRDLELKISLEKEKAEQEELARLEKERILEEEKALAKKMEEDKKLEELKKKKEIEETLRKASEEEKARKKQEEIQRKKEEKERIKKEREKKRFTEKLEKVEVSVNRKNYVISNQDYKKDTEKEKEYLIKHKSSLLRVFNNRCSKCGTDEGDLLISYLVFEKNEGGCFSMKHIDGQIINNAIPLCQTCQNDRLDKRIKDFFSEKQLLNVLTKNVKMTKRLNGFIENKNKNESLNLDKNIKEA